MEKLELSREMPAPKPAGGAGKRRAVDDGACRRQVEAIESFMRRRKLNAAQWFRDAGLSNANAWYNLRSGHTFQLSPHTLQRLVAAVPGATLSELLGEPAPQEVVARTMIVRREVRAGAWRDEVEMSPDRHFQAIVPTPPGVARPEDVVLVADSHADAVCRPGSLVFLRAFSALGRQLQVGDLVLVDRVRDARHELTLRELVAGEEGMLLLAYPSRNRANAAVRVPMPTPYRGEVWEIDGDRHQILGVSVVQHSVMADT